jgi:hypothetical protein
MPRDHRYRLALLLIAALPLIAVAGGCNIKDDETEFYNYLDRLRVLAVRAEPPDLVPGESAELSALVFEPDDGEVSYEWSWCPVRGGSSDGFECAIGEKELREFWEDLDTDYELPPYDLGTGETAELFHVFEPETMLALCEAVLADEDVDPLAKLACLMGLEISVWVRVSSGDDEIVALKSVPLLSGKSDKEERNANPDPAGRVVVRRWEDDKKLDEDAPLKADTVYELKAKFDDGTQCGEKDPEEGCLAETFLPGKLAGLDEPEPRRETLTMTWFVTMGATLVDEPGERLNPEGSGRGRPEDEEDETRGVERTAFVDGYEFDDLVKNLWEIPFEPHADEALLYLVLRDERGGVGWAEHRFRVKGGE